MMAESMLTTIDNPYNPFNDWDRWYAFDEEHGYHTTSFLARLVNGSDELSEAQQNDAIDEAIDEVVKENDLGIYTKVYANS
jgi:hypothetical protein